MFGELGAIVMGVRTAAERCMQHCDLLIAHVEQLYHLAQKHPSVHEDLQSIFGMLFARMQNKTLLLEEENRKINAEEVQQRLQAAATNGFTFPKPGVRLPSGMAWSGREEDLKDRPPYVEEDPTWQPVFRVSETALVCSHGFADIEDCAGCSAKQKRGLESKVMAGISVPKGPSGFGLTNSVSSERMDHKGSEKYHNYPLTKKARADRNSGTWEEKERRPDNNHLSASHQSLQESIPESIHERSSQSLKGLPETSAVQAKSAITVKGLRYMYDSKMDDVAGWEAPIGPCDGPSEPPLAISRAFDDNEEELWNPSASGSRVVDANGEEHVEFTVKMSLSRKTLDGGGEEADAKVPIPLPGTANGGIIKQGDDDEDEKPRVASGGSQEQEKVTSFNFLKALGPHLKT